MRLEIEVHALVPIEGLSHLVHPLANGMSKKILGLACEQRIERTGGQSRLRCSFDQEPGEDRIAIDLLFLKALLQWFFQSIDDRVPAENRARNCGKKIPVVSCVGEDLLLIRIRCHGRCSSSFPRRTVVRRLGKENPHLIDRCIEHTARRGRWHDDGRCGQRCRRRCFTGLFLSQLVFRR